MQMWRNRRFLNRQLFWVGLVLHFGAGEVTAQLPPPPSCPPPVLYRLQRHIVAPGETVESIAKAYNLTSATVMGMNPALQGGSAPPGTEIFLPPFDGIIVDIGVGESWQSLSAKYNVREDVLFEVNGCQTSPTAVFIPGVAWSPGNATPPYDPKLLTPKLGVVETYPLPTVSTVLLRYGSQQMPLKGEVGFHSGIDLQASVGTPVLAVNSGTVAFVGPQGSYGNLVVINHARGKQTRYAHLEEVLVSTGQVVNAGEQVGTVGTTGKPDLKEPHLHFEVRYNTKLGWVAEDPQGYLEEVPMP
jgi:murein DD-endopeptidase MepM/ murein hydrolase activator NlpD